MKQIQDQMMNELQAYFEANHGKNPDERSGSLPNLVNGLENKINDSLVETSSPDEFIKTIMGKIESYSGCFSNKRNLEIAKYFHNMRA